MVDKMHSLRKIKTYSDLIAYKTFEDRFNYLKEDGRVGDDTFGYDRYLNQRFYQSVLWHRIRNEVICRDCGNDLGLDGYPIYGRIIIHHLNPLTEEDIIEQTPFLTDPEYLICSAFETHNAIHYSDESILIKEPIIRKPGDTTLW